MSTANVRGRVTMAADAESCADWVKRAAAEKAGMVITGAQRLEASLPGDEARAVLSTAKLDRILEHEIQDLTLTCEAGCTLGTLARTVARAGQRLVIETPDPDAYTIGGIIAGRVDGFIGGCYGSVRDQILGIKVVLADGSITKSGGRVVKNVTGYDLAKLYTGSRGALGVIVEVTLRLRAVAPGTRTFVLERSNSDDALVLALRLRNLPGLVTGVAIAGGQAVAPGTGPWLVCVRVEGRRDTLADLARLVREAGGNAETLVGDDADGLWRALADFPKRQAVEAELFVAPSKVAAAVRSMDKWGAPGRGFVVDVLSGRITATLASTSGDLEAALSSLDIANTARECDAFASVPSDPLDWPRRAARFGARATAEAALLKRLKAAFDPGSLFADGRLAEEMA